MDLVRHPIAIAVILGMVFVGGVVIFITPPDPCDAGYMLSISADEGNDSTHPKHFEELAPVDQRLFLEAYTTNNFSDLYEGSGNFENLSRADVVYRGQRFNTGVVSSNC